MAGSKLHSSSLTKEIAEKAIKRIQEDPFVTGILLCEGDESSIDKAVYSAIFEDLYVFPVGSCETVKNILPRVRKRLLAYGVHTFGIIDRDALSKIEMRQLLKCIGVTTTKLPFIENMICTPEMIRVICQKKGFSFEEKLHKIQITLMRVLWQKLKEALPINIGIRKNERLWELMIGATTKKNAFHKVVTKENILYVFRDKVVVSVVAASLGINGKQAYYNEIKQLLSSEEYKEVTVKNLKKYIGKFPNDSE